MTPAEAAARLLEEATRAVLSGDAAELVASVEASGVAPAAAASVVATTIAAHQLVDVYAITVDDAVDTVTAARWGSAGLRLVVEQSDRGRHLRNELADHVHATIRQGVSA